MHRVIIVGGGFGGLNVARQLRRADATVTLIDRRNFHLFQPLLYQVATGGLSPANIAAPLRALLKRQANAEILLAEVIGIDVKARKVIFVDGEMPYDTLVLATGVRHLYFGHDTWEPFAPGLKTIEDATEMRRRIFTAFEEAERLGAANAANSGWLTFVVVGGGPTGVELAGMLCELARFTLRGNFRHIDPATARVLLIEATQRILPGYKEKLSFKAAASLEHLGATIRTNCRVIDIQPHAVTVESTNGVETIATRTILWAAGVQASPLGKVVATATGAALDRAGRIIVEPDCCISGHPEVFVIGDLASLAGTDGKPLPGVAQPAIQEGRYVGRLIAARLKGQTIKPFRYRDLGDLATIGRHAAVADLRWWTFSGWFAWWVWLLVHLINLVQFQNRVLVLVQWAWSYFSRNRAARLITETPQEIEVKELGRPPPKTPISG